MAARHREELETMAEYRPLCLHPPLFSPHVDPLWLAPSMLSLFGATPERAAARRAGEGLLVPPTAEAVRSFVEEVAPGIYAFDFFSDAFCDRLLAELEHYEDSGLPVSRPNSMNNYGVVLNLIGMERTMDALQALIVRPIAAALFPVEGETVDHHHSFMVQYKQGEDLGLDMHTDACDVTLNVCLGKEFTGAGLTFCGLRGDGSGRERRFLYRHAHRKGRAVFHLGHQRHGADDIETGERFNLIMWNKSSAFRATRDFMSKYSKNPTEDSDPPDLVCLSYTHDDDYEQYRPYPPGKRPKREAGG